jgi:beta-N-acetylhexosaminidase
MRSLEESCARMVMVGFPGQQMDSDLEALIRRGVFGAILFKRNVGTPAETAALCHKMKSFAGRPFTLAVDQEGGRVARLRGAPFTALGPMRDIGNREDEALAERVGRLLAHEVRAIGFDWDFAPVLDVDTNPQNPVIGDRSFHHDAAKVAKYAVATARGLELGGVASCAKHFPGHGDTNQDSHHTLPRSPHDLKRLRDVELVPFVAYAKAGLASVMTAHVMFDAVDSTVPATMSPAVMTTMLRQELGFEGVIVSDDLEMKAILDCYHLGEAAVLGALAGVDLFLVCHKAERQRLVIDSLIDAVKKGRLPKSRVEEANDRLDVMEKKFTRPPEDLLQTLGSPEHRTLAQGLQGGLAGSDPTEAVAIAARS